MTIPKRLFLYNITEKRSSIKIVLWWEKRRILYNVLLIAFGIISLIVLSFIVKDLWSFFSPPIFLFLAIGVFIFFANLFYTCGWIFQIVTRNTTSKFIYKIRPYLFVYGLIFSFGIELTPSIVAGAYTIITGKRIKSQYADFTVKEPELRNIIGDYKLSSTSKQQLNYPDSLLNKSVIRFKSDSTFEFKFFPNNEGMDLQDYEIINAEGRWSIEKDQGNWVVPLEFTAIVNSFTGERKGKYFNSNGFHINRDKPPYEIYIIVGDPDSWYGVTLEKK